MAGNAERGKTAILKTQGLIEVQNAKTELQKLEQAKNRTLAESVNTEISRVQIDIRKAKLASTVADHQIALAEVQGRRHDLTATKHGVEAKRLNAEKAQTQTGIVGDELKALNAERKIRQNILREGLVDVSLALKEAQEKNSMRRNLMVAEYGESAARLNEFSV